MKDKLNLMVHLTDVSPSLLQERKMRGLLEHLKENNIRLIHGQNHIEISIEDKKVGTAFLLM